MERLIKRKRKRLTQEQKEALLQRLKEAGFEVNFKEYKIAKDNIKVYLISKSNLERMLNLIYQVLENDKKS
jgi:ribosomal protein S8